MSPADTTGVTQLLDQLNKNIHQEYEKEKACLFTDFNTLNREAFMIILANIWDKWASKESITNAARKVGVTTGQLSVETMQQDKFARAAECIDLNQNEASPSTSITSTPGSSIISPHKRRGSAQYWEDKFNQAMNTARNLMFLCFRYAENFIYSLEIFSKTFGFRKLDHTIIKKPEVIFFRVTKTRKHNVLYFLLSENIKFSCSQIPDNFTFSVVQKRSCFRKFDLRKPEVFVLTKTR